MGSFRKSGAGSTSRLTWALATFIGVAATAGGAGALDNITLDGPATLEQLTRDVIAACPGATGLSYQGKWNFTTSPTAYEAGEADLLFGEQTIAPMRRSFGTGPLGTTFVCDFPKDPPPKDATRIESLVFGFDAPAFVVSQASVGSCNAGAADCNPTTDPNSGLARSRVITFPGGGTYTYTDWTDVLRIVFAGMKQGDGHNLLLRDCNSTLRQTIVNNWGNIFQTNCTGTNCTQLQHVFRLPDTSDTTEVLLALLDLPYLDSVQGPSNGAAHSPFCNAVYPVTSGPRIPDFQDNDPIRRQCIGTGNLPLPPNTMPPTQPTEQVCGKSGTLGLVLPIQPPPIRATETPLPYPTTPCARGRFVFGAAPTITATTYDRCPNGDVPLFGGQCFVPVDANDNPQCLNGKSNLPLYKFDPIAADATDGRVYNLHLRKSDGSYQTIRRPGLIPGQFVEQRITGAFYRIHQTRTALPAPSTTGTCAESDPSLQISCLVKANPCSVGMLSAGAPEVSGVPRIKVNGLDPTAACIRNALSGSGPVYPLASKLFLNTFGGFENVTGQERQLASCFANQTLMGTILAARGFVSLGQNARCEDFNETAFCGVSTNQNACANNAGVGLPTSTAYCGNGSVEFPEQCDDGKYVVSPPEDTCSAGCTTCGDGTVTSPESCDSASSSCTSQCGFPRNAPCTQIGTGAPLAIDDGNACTVDTCDPTTGRVSHARISSGPCGKFCISSADCSSGETCAEKAGARFGLSPNASVCLDPRCLSDPVSTGCGEPPSKCGSCACIPNCAEKMCGDDPSDGCGGYCRGICQVGEACTRNEECPFNRICENHLCEAPSVFPPFPPGVPPGTVVTSQEVGVIPGSGGVTPDGAYSYSIPLRVAPGRAGLEPELSLGYNSRSGNGHLGVGWSLGGLSSITRCNKTMATDGAVEGIQFDDGDGNPGTDSFCLDGARLRTVPEEVVRLEGGELQSGSVIEYRTERDSFSRIRRYVGADAGGCDYFTVEAKNGRILRYDPLVDSGPDGCRTVEWPVSRIEDRVGNAIRFTYESEPNSLENRIQEITYTLGTGQTQGNRLVSFEYEPRDDEMNGFVNGEPRSVRQRLKFVNMFAPEQSGGPAAPLWSYELHYQQSTQTRRSLLHAVDWTDAHGKRMPTTTFEYAHGESDQGFSEYPSDLVKANVIGPIAFDGPGWTHVSLVDLNGDGRDDLVYSQVVPGRSDMWPDLFVALSFGGVFGTPREIQGVFSSPGGVKPFEPSSMQFADLNNDGRMEMIVGGFFPSGHGTSFLRWDDSGTFVALGPLVQQVRSTSERVVFADLDGNGILDILHPRFDQKWYRTRDIFRLQDCTRAPPGFCVVSPDLEAFSTNVQWNPQSADQVVDLNGDGAVELFSTAQAGQALAQLIREPSVGGVFAAEQLEAMRAHLMTLSAIEPRWFADVNGDGLKDLVRADLKVELNTGRDFGPPYQAYAGNFVAESPTVSQEVVAEWRAMVRVADFNHDGFDDLLLLQPRDPQRQFVNSYLDAFQAPPVMYYSDGRSFHRVSMPPGLPRVFHRGVSGAAVPQFWSGTALGDVDGDGHLELVSAVTAGSGFNLEIRSSFPGDLGSPDWRGRQFDVLTRVAGGLTSGDAGAEKVEYATVGTVGAENVPSLGSPVYERGTECLFPQRCLTRGLDVVASHVPASQSYRVLYSYADGRLDSMGRGFLGFADVTRDNSLTLPLTPGGSVVQTHYDNQTRVEYGAPVISGGPYYYPFAGLPETVTVYTGSRRVETVNYFVERARPGPLRYVTELQTSTVKEFDDQSVGHAQYPFRQVATTAQWDDFGNLLYVERSVTSNPNPNESDEVQGDTTRTTSRYDNDTGHWLIGLLRKRRTHSTTFFSDGDLVGEQTRHVSFDYDGATGLLRKMTIEPNDPQDNYVAERDVQLETTYVRNGFGLVERIEQRGATGGLRVQSVGYDADGAFPRRVENAMGHVELVEYHPGFGVPAISADQNGVVSTFQYDGFGRLRGEFPGGGMPRHVAYRRVSADLPVRIDETTDGGGRATTDLDNFGRVARKIAYDLSGEPWTTAVLYDERGRLYQETLPFSSSLGMEAVGHVQYEYDTLNRITRVSRPDALVRVVHYPTPLTTLSIDGSGQSSLVTRDMNGRIVRTQQGYADPRSLVIPPLESATAPRTFTYLPFGLLGDGAGRTLSYDVLGRLTDVRDPDAGHRANRYNSFGELRETVDPADETTFYFRDALGRVQREISPDLPNGETTFGWDGNALGALSFAHSTDDVTTLFAYDDAGRLAQKTQVVDGVQYAVNQEYDDLGRLKTVRYPNPDGETEADRFAVVYVYNPFSGYLEGVRATTSINPFWHALGMTPYSEYEEAGLGLTTARSYDPRNLRLVRSVTRSDTSTAVQDLNYLYFANGDVQRRTDAATNIADDYTYDALGRLETWGRGDRNEHYFYDDLGRINHVDLRITPTAPTNVTTYQYAGVRGAGPDAPTSIGSVNYSYDDFGRQKDSLFPNGKHETIDYTSFDLPKHFVAPGGSATDFSYDAFEGRAKKENSGASTVYMDGLFERRTSSDGEVSDVLYVYAGGRLVAEVTDGTVAYVHADPQGSVSLKTDARGTFSTRLGFSPFGARITETGAPPLKFTGNPIGYTGQEHDDDLGLINMRGRVYDPNARKFLTPDPIIASVFDGQSHNPYAYVRNNPIRYTDPSGWAPCGPQAGMIAPTTCDMGIYEVTISSWTVGPEKKGPHGPAPVKDGLTGGTVTATPDGNGPSADSSGGILEVSPSSDPTIPGGLVGPGSSANTAESGPGVRDDGHGTKYVTGGPGFKPTGDPFIDIAAALSAMSGQTVSVVERPVTLDDVQDTLDATSLAAEATVVGEPIQIAADIVNAGISLGRGDPVGAGLSAAAAVPGAGSVLNVSRLARSAAKKAARAAAHATGQLHHAISRRVWKALQESPTLRGMYQARDSRFVTKAADAASHTGYQAWHRAVDAEVSAWVRANPNATPAQFESYLGAVYRRPEMMQRFPGGLR